MRYKLTAMLGVLTVIVAAVILWRFFFQELTISAAVDKESARQMLAQKISRGFLTWSREGTIYMTKTKPWSPRALFKGDHPRWSPDGQKIVYTEGFDIWVFDLENEKRTKLLSDVVIEYGTGAYWSNSGNEIIAISRKNPRQVLKYSFRTGETAILHDEGIAPFNGYRLSQCAELRFDGKYLLSFTTDENHQSFIVDLISRQYINNQHMRDGDCEPAWSPDGRFLIHTRRSRERPLFITRFDYEKGVVTEAEYLIGKGRCHNVSISNDNNFIVYISSGKMYFWDLRDKVELKRHGLMLFSNGKNRNPSLYVLGV